MDDVFSRKAKEFDSLIRYASKRYTIQGVLDRDDLYQEGLLILNSMLDKYDFDPDSIDFRKMFKTELWHGLWKHLRYHKTKKRDHKLTVHESSPQKGDVKGKRQMRLDNLNNGDRAGANAGSSSYGESIFEAHIADASDQFSMHEDEQLIEEFKERLVARLDTMSNVVLSELLYPPDWDEIPEACKLTRTGEVYWRQPSKIPEQVMANYLGMTLSHVRKCIRKIKEEGIVLAEELGFYGMSNLLENQ